MSRPPLTLLSPSGMLPGIASAERLVEVSLPVPLRRAFTYRWPAGLGPIQLGARVAVPFRGRKLAGYIVGEAAAAPEGVRKLRTVAGRLEREPVFPPELLRFLEEAAAYYVHPLGEVLRIAGPALEQSDAAGLRADGFLEPGEQLPGPSVRKKRVLFVRALDVEPAHRLGQHQRRALALLADREEMPLSELSASIPRARAVVQALERRALVVSEERVVADDPFSDVPATPDSPPTPTPEQQAAIDAMTRDLGRASTRLLHGVTGSGKTEVYLRVIAEVRRRGQGAIVLVPEIALTPQLVGRFRARFGDTIAVLHSGLRGRQRYDAWRRLRTGELHIAVGARSAVFAPVPRLGAIVVDEEHDPSFKQEEGFRYHARDLAILRAHRANALCILGSATPSVETSWRARRGHTELSRLSARATSNALPSIEVVDLRRHGPGPSGHPLLSGPLHRALEDCLSDDGQAILFLNRRGFAPTLRCRECGFQPECSACSVALTEHRRLGLLRCHYCDFAISTPSRCPACGSPALEPLGLGTERLAEALETAFAPARVARLDRDTASGLAGVEAVLGRLRRREVDVLVGTQMVTKGHDLPGVTLVGVVLADQSLAFPDFRASERTFQLLLQVAGRAGRGDRPGRAVFQTFQPEHPALRAAQRHDYEAFYRSELADREELGYAPFSRLVAVRLDGPDEAKARAAVDALAAFARRHPDVGQHVEVLGPAPAPIERIRGRFRFRFLLRAPSRPPLRRVALAVAERIEDAVPSPLRAHVDVDPVHML